MRAELQAVKSAMQSSADLYYFIRFNAYNINASEREKKKNERNAMWTGARVIEAEEFSLICAQSITRRVRVGRLLNSSISARRGV